MQFLFLCVSPGNIWNGSSHLYHCIKKKQAEETSVKKFKFVVEIIPTWLVWERHYFDSFKKFLLGFGLGLEV
jgi:hypothetical protein